MRLRLPVMGAGVGAALAVAFPAALVGQVVDALVEGDDTPAAVYLLVPVILGAMVLGGWVTGARGRSAADARPRMEAAVTGLLAITVVLGLGAARQAAAGDDVAWATVPGTALVAVALAVAGSALGRRAPGRTRP